MTQPRAAKSSPEQPRAAQSNTEQPQSSLEQPRAAQSSPEQLREAQSSQEQSRAGQSSPEQIQHGPQYPRTAQIATPRTQAPPKLSYKPFQLFKSCIYPCKNARIYTHPSPTQAVSQTLCSNHTYIHVKSMNLHGPKPHPSCLTNPISSVQLFKT